jgi:hypothetical protein
MGIINSPTKRSVSDIKANLLRPALSSHFEVEIPVPAKLNEKSSGSKSFLESNGLVMGSNDQIQLNLMCCEATLPGSNLATLEINNDFTGVTERHAYRRVYDDRIDLTFYVDAQNYLPIRFFETWIKFIVDESVSKQPDKNVGSKSPGYFYRVRYPEEYMCADGLIVRKFERDYSRVLQYEFVNSYPISVSSIPVAYDGSSLLKCTVSMSYVRYILNNETASDTADPQLSPEQQAALNTLQLSPGSFTQNPTFSGEFSIGGVPDIAANASGNTVK